MKKADLTIQTVIVAILIIMALVVLILFAKDKLDTIKDIILRFG